MPFEYPKPPPEEMRRREKEHADAEADRWEYALTWMPAGGPCKRPDGSGWAFVGMSASAASYDVVHILWRRLR